MPQNKPFKDSAGRRGTPSKAPLGEIEVQSKPTAKSLSGLSNIIHCEIKDSYLILNLQQVVTDRIRIKITDARRLSEWILTTKPKRTKNGAASKAKT